MSVLRYGCTTWILAKHLEKKLVINYTKMLRAALKKSSKQHPTKKTNKTKTKNKKNS